MEDRPIRVFLIEDNPGDVRLIREMLAEARWMKFTLDSAPSLSEGLELACAGSFDVLLLDLSLPDSRGLATLRRALSRATETPVVVLTGLDDEQVGLQTLNEGAQDFLVKGKVDSDLLARSIRYAMERKRKQRELEAFTTTISHDLRTPLGIVRGFLEIIRDRPEMFDEFFDDVIGQVDGLLAFIDDLLSLSRLGKIIEKTEDVFKTGATIEEVFAALSLGGEPAELEMVEPPADLRGDSGRLRQVVTNLVQNSFHHRDPGKEILKITVTHELVEGQRRIRFRDNGKGIAAEDLPRIFNIGFSTREGGSGFGLAIAKKIVEAHGGSITASSGGAGAGAEFVIAMPSHAKSPLPSPSPSPSSPPPSASPLPEGGSR